MDNLDVRWKQRFANYIKALEKLTEAVNYVRNNSIAADGALSDILREGLIQRFEYTHELAWNVMKDYAEFQGISVGGSRDATREAFSLKIIKNGESWMDMIRSRNETSHTYNNNIAKEIVAKILDEYYALFLDFKKIMETK
jgi:nucleotidyltransferase substrate binding protein (TIGR01987 family)